ncbi:MAG: GMC family oxidoreductase [Deltaproteobacteria bacterium]|nr:GMC family oxidoreductase [Deltaproteobacteria bacterium]
MASDYDVLVVGSGFGGSVAALRLSEKGYKVAVLEAGKRFRPQDFAETSWDLRRFLFWPAIGCYGIQRITLMRHVMVLAGAGVGGGSLVYANTLLVPPAPFFRDPQWAALDPDWRTTLAPHYATAKQMLGVATNPKQWRADEALADYGRELGRADRFHLTEVGVFFGEPGVEVDDPYFGGKGPRRVGCTHTGHCMVGCKNGGKNSLDRNYLYLAEALGAQIIPDTTVTDLVPRDGGYDVVARRTSGLWSHPQTVYRAARVVLAAGALGTNRILMRARDRGHLPKLSARLGTLVRTNSEILNGLMSNTRGYDYSRGIAITSGLWVDEQTHVEPVRYPKGSGLMLMLGTLMVDAGGRVPRWLKWLGAVVRQPLRFLRTLWPFHRAENSTICLVMQNADNHLELKYERRWWWPFAKRLTTDVGAGRLPTTIPAGDAAAKAIARRLDAVPLSAVTDILLDTPITAHILGGCAIGRDPEAGVVDKHCRVFGYDNLYVVDGAMIPANLGVNPGLTITAIAEYAMSQIAKKA